MFADHALSSLHLTSIFSPPYLLQPDGRLMEGSPSSNDDGFSTFFSETGAGKHVPRSLYVSMSLSTPLIYAG